MSGDTVSKSLSILKKNLGVTSVEAKAFLPVILGGNMTIGGVAEATGEKLQTVARALERLVQKGLLTKVDGIVPVYRLAPAYLPIGDKLESLIKDIDGLKKELLKTYDTYLGNVQKNVDEILGYHKTTTDDANIAFKSYEDKAVKTVETQIDMVAALSTTALEQFTQSMEQMLEELATIVDDGLGTRLTALQVELDKSQKQLERDLSAVSREFKTWSDSERKTTAASFTQFRKKALSLVSTAQTAVEKAMNESKKALTRVAIELNASVSSRTTNVSQNAIQILTEASEDLEDMAIKHDAEVKSARTSSEAAFSEASSKGIERITEDAEFAKARVQEAVEISDSINEIVNLWISEVGDYMDSASQSLSSHLNQVESAGTSYLDLLKNAVVTHLEKARSLLNEEYASLTELAVTKHSELESSLSDARVAAVNIIQKRLQDDEAQLDQTSTAIQSEVDDWSKKTVKGLETRLTKAANDVQAILDTEAAEMATLSGSINSRLKSAFNTALSDSATKQEAALTSVKKTTHDFEANIDKRLSEIITGYTTKTGTQIKEASALYNALSKRLENHLTESVSKIASWANEIQKEIDAVRQDQIERIDIHTQGIRDEFHTHLEDVTRQFISFTQGLEATFNGFMASQTVEARDLISSVHTDFKSSLKSEMAVLQEESSLLKLEFSSEFQKRIDRLVEAADTMKKVLEDFTVEKRSEVSESMTNVLSQIQEAAISTHQGLEAMESTTIAEFRDSLQQMSDEFGVSVTSAKQNINEQIESAKETASNTAHKSVSQIRTAVDAYVVNQSASRQQLVADMNNDFEKVVARVLGKSSKNVESFQASLAEKETASMESGRATRDGAISAIDAHRQDLSTAFAGASESVTSAVSRVEATFESMCSKLNSNIAALRDVLETAAETTAAQISSKGQKTLNELEKINLALLDKTESAAVLRSKGFVDRASAVLIRAGETLSNLPKDLEDAHSEIITTSTNELAEAQQGVIDSFSEALGELESACDATTTDAKGTVTRTTEQLNKTLERALGDAKASTLTSNQFSLRKLESIGHDLNTYLDSETSRLVEKSKSESTAVNSDIAASVSKARNDTSESVSNLRQARNDAFTNLKDGVGKTLRSWSAKQKQELEALRMHFEKSLDTASEAASGTGTMIEAVQNAANEILAVEARNTWYVTGNDEIRAHMVDMANRAERSIILSILTPRQLDIKKLAKIKAPKRKILVVPAAEELDTELETLVDWRIWTMESPTLLAVADNKEVLVGGSEDSKKAMAVVSTEPAYLRLYSEFLGPRLTQERSKV